MNPEAFLARLEDRSSASSESLAELLDAIGAFIRQFVVISPAQADAIALWVLHTWVIAAADVTPFLAITSAEMRSGKTRLLEALELLVRRPWRAISPSEAVLFRKVSAQEPTLLLDETDAIFNPKAKDQEGLRALLNAGNRRGSTVDRCVPAGNTVRLETFSVFCARALAGIGKLPATIADRSLLIRLKRRARSEKVERFRLRSISPVAEAMRSQIETWAAVAAEQLRLADPPHVPDSLDDRQADGVEPLLSIADLAGKDWPKRGRAAFEELCAGEGAGDESLGVRLLADIRRVFATSDRLPSGALVKALTEDDEAPWGDLKGRTLTTRVLGRLLSPYGIASRSIRLDDGRTPKGYYRAAFAEAWERYLPPPETVSEPPESEETASYPPQPPQVNNDTGSLDFFDPPQQRLVADGKNAESSIKTGIVADVADRKPEEEPGELNGASAGDLEARRVLL